MKIEQITPDWFQEAVDWDILLECNLSIINQDIWAILTEQCQIGYRVNHPQSPLLHNQILWKKINQDIEYCGPPNLCYIAYDWLWNCLVDDEELYHN